MQLTALLGLVDFIGPLSDEKRKTGIRTQRNERQKKGEQLRKLRPSQCLWTD